MIQQPVLLPFPLTINVDDYIQKNKKPVIGHDFQIHYFFTPKTYQDWFYLVRCHSDYILNNRTRCYIFNACMRFVEWNRTILGWFKYLILSIFQVNVIWGWDVACKPVTISTGWQLSKLLSKHVSTRSFFRLITSQLSTCSKVGFCRHHKKAKTLGYLIPRTFLILHMYSGHHLLLGNPLWNCSALHTFTLICFNMLPSQIKWICKYNI